jgi:hypothetical protein
MSSNSGTVLASQTLQEQQDKERRLSEMRMAAAAAVALALEENLRAAGLNGHAKPGHNGHASAWVVNARMTMTNRWPG